MRQLILFLAIFSYSICFSQTTDQIAQNGGFESGIGYPTDQNQLTGRCDHWLSAATTPDWYTTQNLPGALRGACNFENGDNSAVINAIPKLATHDGSLFYGGFGSTEYMRNELSRSTYAYSLVKISFWFSPRGITGNTRIGVLLIDYDDGTGQSNLEFTHFDVNVTGTNPPFTTCQWYYYESDWLPTGQNTFEQIQIGGMSPPNFAGAFNEAGYIYVDDANVYNGLDCCPPFVLYEDNDNLSHETHVSDYIIAGFDAGITNISGNVIVHNGQNVSFEAGNTIQLRPGFSVESGGNFSAIIHDCNPFTQQQGNDISVQTLPNVFTPNGDNVNDELCFNVTGAQYYRIQIFSRWGTNNQTLVYVHTSSLTSNIVCTWDGGNSNDGTYYYIIEFSNCTQFSTYSSFLTLLRGNQRMANQADSLLTNTLKIFPNPASNNLFIEFPVSGNEGHSISIFDSQGRIALFKNSSENKVEIDLSAFANGIYFIQIKNTDGKTIGSEKIIKAD